MIPRHRQETQRRPLVSLHRNWSSKPENTLTVETTQLAALYRTKHGQP